MQNIRKIKRAFQTLGDINRLKIISVIGLAERSVSYITDAVELSQPLVSHHLRALRENGILKSNRKGPFVYYELQNPRLLDALNLFSEIFIDQGEDEDSSDESEPFCFRWMRDFCSKK